MRWIISVNTSELLHWTELEKLVISKKKWIDFLNEYIKNNFEQLRTVFKIDTNCNEISSKHLIYGELVSIFEILYNILQTANWEWIITWTYEELATHPVFELWLLQLKDKTNLAKILFDEISKKHKSNVVDVLLARIPGIKKISNDINRKLLERWIKELELSPVCEITDKWVDILRDLLSANWNDLEVFKIIMINNFDNLFLWEIK